MNDIDNRINGSFDQGIKAVISYIKGDNSMQNRIYIDVELEKELEIIIRIKIEFLKHISYLNSKEDFISFVNNLEDTPFSKDYNNAFYNLRRFLYNKIIHKSHFGGISRFLVYYNYEINDIFDFIKNQFQDIDKDIENCISDINKTVEEFL